MAQDTSGAGAAGGTTRLVIPGEMAARVDRLPMSFMAWEICLIVQVGWTVSANTDGIARILYPFIWGPAKEITHTQYDVLYALQVGISILIGGYALGWLGRQDRPAQGTDPVLPASRRVHLAVRVRDQLPRAVCPVDRRHPRVRRVPGHQRRVHERDHRADGPAPGHDGLPGGSHLPALCRTGRPRPALLDPRPLPVAAVDDGRAEPRGGDLPVLPDARVAALAGGQGTPRRGPQGRGDGWRRGS